MRVKLEFVWALIFLLCSLLCGPLTSFIWLVSFYPYSHSLFPFPTISTMSSKLFSFFFFIQIEPASFSELHTLHTVHLTMRTHRVSVPQIRQTGRLIKKNFHFFCALSLTILSVVALVVIVAFVPFFHKRLPGCLCVCSFVRLPSMCSHFFVHVLRTWPTTL